MEITCELLGVTQDELLEIVVSKLAGQIEFPDTKIAEVVKERVNKRADMLFSDHVAPKIDELIENVTIQRTNQWGEAKGQSMTFIEYLTQAAENYLREVVDYEGETKDESHSSYWKKSGTRVSYLVHKHLQYSIETAMEGALKTANDSIVEGLAGAVKIKLGEVREKLNVKVTTK